MNPRRLVLCLDGTWNSTYVQKMRDDGHQVLKPSNVLKLCRAVLPVDPATGREQIAWYDAGVGSLSPHPGASNRMLAGEDPIGELDRDILRRAGGFAGAQIATA